MRLLNPGSEFTCRMRKCPTFQGNAYFEAHRTYFFYVFDHVYGYFLTSSVEGAGPGVFGSGRSHFRRKGVGVFYLGPS